jgi:hypothetical protein
MKYLIDFLTSAMFKRFLWNTLAGFLAIAAVFVGSIDWIYAPLLFAVFNGLSKEFNKRYGNIE